MNKKPIIAICYDFDNTLSPKNMQEYGFIEKLGISADQFWSECSALEKANNMDTATGYMFYMVEKYRREGIDLTKKTLEDCGKDIELFKGVKEWFKRINEFGEKNGVIVEHYIISSGNKEMISRTPIASEFKEIFASSYLYDENDRPIWPAVAVNYTNKTQFLFRINKGIFDINDHRVNDSMDHDLRRIPFRNIIYVGDSTTDVPCMRLTVKQGGVAIGVYTPTKKNVELMLKLHNDNRINYFVEADYTDESEMDKLMKEIVLAIKHRENLRDLSSEQNDKIINLKTN